MAALLSELRHNPLLWLLVFVPVVFVAQSLEPEAHTLLFVLSVLAIVPLATLLSHATESVAAKTGDTVGGLLNATLGNLTELVIALAALSSGQYMLVKASIAGAIVTNSLFMLGASFLLGGLKYHVQEFNRISARLQASLLFLATIALLIPSAVRLADAGPSAAFTQQLSLGLSGLLILAYGLGMVFSLRTHRELFAAAEHGNDEEAPWPIGRGARHAGRRHGAGGACERGVRRIGATSGRGIRDDSRVRRFHRRRDGWRCGGDGVGVFRRAQEPARSERGHCIGKRLADRVVRGPGARAAQLCDRPDADGSAIVARRCDDDAHRDAHRLARDQRRTIRVVRRRARLDGLPDLRDDAVPLATRRAMTSPVGMSQQVRAVPVRRLESRRRRGVRRPGGIRAADISRQRSSRMKHFLLFYDVADDYLDRRTQFRSAHLEKAWAVSADGTLVLAGALADPVDGAVLLFAAPDKAVVEGFARADPYVLNGLVTRWRVREWSTVAGPGAATPVRP